MNNIMLLKAIELAVNAHGTQTGQDGQLQILHSLRVMGCLAYFDDGMIVGVLHDVIEDTDITIEYIDDEFPPHIAEALRLLTHNKSEPHSEYVDRIIDSKDRLATMVKFFDMKDNQNRLHMIDDLSVRYRIDKKYNKVSNRLEKAFINNKQRRIDD